MRATAVAVCGATVWIAAEAWRLPRAEILREQILAQGELRGKRPWVPLWAISTPLRTSVRVWEDPAYYHHGALNYPEIARAAWINLRTMRFERGASTITQQVVKNRFLGREKTIRRKLREAILAHRLEQVLTKDEIFAVYLNLADWGDGITGVEAASRRLFGRAAAELDWADAALMAGMLPNPRQLNPCRYPLPALRARRAVLRKLLEHGELKPREFLRADEKPLPTCGARG